MKIVKYIWNEQTYTDITNNVDNYTKKLNV